VTYFVVGAGFTGATVAERIATVLGEEVLVVERRPYVGGSAADYRTDDGLLIQRYGPHVFHTNSARVWEYAQRFATWRPIKYKVAAQVGDQLYPLPLGFEAVRRGAWARGLGQEIIERLTEVYGRGARVGIRELQRHAHFQPLADWAIKYIFRGYNEKHWGLAFEDVPQSVIARLPFIVGDQETYFTDEHQAVPVDGYTETISRMLDHPKIKIRLGHAINGPPIWWRGDRIIWTGSPDDFFGEDGALPYRSVQFDISQRGLRDGWSAFHTVTNPEHDGPTRATNMALMNGVEDTPASVIVTDYPSAYKCGKNEPLYPIPLEANIRLAQEYASRAPKNVWFAGRLGSYTYLNMDQAIARGLALFERIKSA